MRIDRFGDTYAGAYAFSAIDGSDEFSASRSPVVKGVALADGVYDFFGNDPFPLGAQTLPKKLAIYSATYAGIDTALSTLKLNTVGRGMSKLWRIWRDGTTVQWCWAKCIDLKHGEAAGENYLRMPVDLTFLNPGGKWYATTESSFLVVNASGSTSVVGNGTLTAGGETDALVRIVSNPIDDGLTSIRFDNLTTGQYAKLLAPESSGLYYIDSAAYRVYRYSVPSHVPWYDNFEWNRQSFFSIRPGANNLRVTVTAPGFIDEYSHTFYWYDTFL